MNRFLVMAVFFSVLLPGTGYAFNCSVTASSVSFGSYDVFSSAPLDSTGVITLSCSNPENKPLPVTISIGSGASGTFNPRQMRLAGGTDRMNYFLFLDPAKTTIWGDSTGGTSTVSATIVRNPSLILPVYGEIPANQNLRAGSYSDTLLVTVLW